MDQLKFNNSFLYKTRERIIPGAVSMSVLSDHYSRYVFAASYCADRRVLNVASGCGYGSEVLMRKAREVFNVDISENLIAFGNNKYGSCFNHFIKMDAQNLALPDNFFDAIVSFETLEHLPDPERFIAECFRVLKDDGTLILSTPNKTVSSPDTEKPYNKFHFKEWKLEALKEELSKHYNLAGVYGQNYIFPRTMPGGIFNSINAKLNEVVYKLTPGGIFKIIKKYVLKYQEYGIDEVVIDETSRVREASEAEFQIGREGRSYLVMILRLSKRKRS